MIKHRLIDPLKKELEKGKNVIFFHGMKEDENYFYDYIRGMLNSKDTFKIASLSSKEENILFSNKYIDINSKSVNVFEKIDNEITDITEEFFNQEQPEDDFDDIEDEENKGNSKESKEIENTGSLFENRLKLVEEKIKEKKEKYFIFIDELEWLANLYSSNPKDSALDYVKYIKDWSKIKDVKVIIKISNIDLIKDFDFDLENNSIFIGNPSGEEIQRMYLRKFLSQTELENQKLSHIVSELKDISFAVSSSNNTLKSADRIYDNIVKQNSNYQIDKKDFEITTEKIIEEKVNLDDVILNDKTKNEILGAVDNFLNDKEGKTSRKGLILTGPPGTGKTFLVKAIANERNCYFISPSLADLKGEYVGHTSAKVKRIFEKARANEPAILFIDEADTIFTSRNDAGGIGSDSFNLDMVNQFLVEIDGMTTGKQKVFVIAATNRVEAIDSAIKSRLSETITIGLPGFEERKEIFHKKLLKYNFSFREKSFQYEICKKTENMSGRDIDNFVKKLYEIVNNEFREKDLSSFGDDERTKDLFYRILKNQEKELANELMRKIPVEILDPEEIRTNLSDIIGYEKIKRDINLTLKYLSDTNEERSRRKSFEIENQYGILFYGPPGNAKTKLTEAIAKEHNLYYMKVLSKDFVSNKNGNILSNIQLIFNESKRLSKMTKEKRGVLLFFDEFDSLAGLQLDSIVRGTLLDYLANDKDGIRSEDSKVVLMAATNFVDVLDEATTRKGRIDKKIEMLNPTEKDGKKIISTIFSKDRYIAEVDSEIINRIYEKIVKNKNKEKRKLFEITKKISNSNNSEYINEMPSGADLSNTCKELKNIAFNMNSFENEKIVINDLVINEAFGDEDEDEEE